MRPLRLPLGIALCLALAQPVYARQTGAGQTPPPQTPPPTSQTGPPPTAPTPPPETLDRIREAVSHPPALKIENGQLRIYVEVIAKWPSFAEVTKGYDFMNGPTGKGNPMSHQEFLNMVTPREMYGSAGIQPAEILTSALVNYFGQKLIKKGIKEIGEARNEKEIREIRARIDRELAALRGGI